MRFGGRQRTVWPGERMSVLLLPMDRIFYGNQGSSMMYVRSYEAGQDKK